MKRKANGAAARLRLWGSMAGRAAELPATDSFLLEMADDGNLRIRGCRGIAEYTPERITVETDRGDVCVNGRGLFLRRYSDTDAAVDGAVLSIVFGREDI